MIRMTNKMIETYVSFFFRIDYNDYNEETIIFKKERYYDEYD